MAGSYQVNHVENPKGNYIEVEMKGFLVLEKYQPCWLEVLDLIEKTQINQSGCRKFHPYAKIAAK